jgi:uncharacterized protein (DUF302 family)
MLALAAVPPAAVADPLPKPEVIGGAWVYRSEGLFHNVKADLEDAITARGIVVSYVAHAASMLTRTAGAVGAVTRVYDNAEIMLFCKADLTYELTSANPHNLVLCPYGISIYTLADDPGTVFISIRRPDLEVAAYAGIHQLLEAIVADTLSW